MRKWMGRLTLATFLTMAMPVSVMADIVGTGSQKQNAGPYWPGMESTTNSPGGPGDCEDIEKRLGPGVWEEEYGDGTVGESSLEANNFLDRPVPDPVVKAVENYSYDQMAADIQELQKRYGKKMQVNILGKSRDGRDIYEVIIGNVNAPKHILIQGAIHAREHMTSLLMMNQIETALFYYQTGQYEGKKLQDMFQKTALHFIPMSNPDGVTLSQFGLDAIQSDDLKQIILNCYASDTASKVTALPIDQYLARWKSNGAGVDLNHNFPAQWEEIKSMSGQNSYAGYKGAAPLSEPESQALASIAEKYPWVCTISYHSMGNLIYWDSQYNQTREASKTLAQRISSVTGYPVNGSLGKGGYKDWMQSKANPVPAVTLEVGSVRCPLPLSQYEAIWQQNKGVWPQAMVWALEQ